MPTDPTDDDEKPYPGHPDVFVSPAPVLSRYNPGYEGYRRAFELRHEQDMAEAVGSLIGLALSAVGLLVWWLV